MKNAWVFLFALFASAAQAQQNVPITGSIPYSGNAPYTVQVTINGLPPGCSATAVGTVITIAGCSGALPITVSLVCGKSTIQVGQTTQCQASVQNATNANVTYATNNAALATVSASGLVTGIAPGQVNVTANSVQDATKFATVPITVTAAVATPAYVAGSVSAMLNTTTSGNTLTGPMHKIPTTGNTLVCGAIWKSSTPGVLADSVNGGWQALGTAARGVATLSGYTGQMYVLYNAKASAISPVLTFGASFTGGKYMECAEYTASVMDGVPIYSVSPATARVAQIGGVTTSNPNDVLIAMCLGVTTSCNAGPGFTWRNDTNAWDMGTNSGGVNYLSRTGQGIEDMLTTNAGPQVATFATGAAADDMVMGLMALAPQGVSVQHSVTLNWTPGQVSNPPCTATSCPAPVNCFGPAATYNIYKSLISGNYSQTYAQIAAPTTTFTDLNVKPADTWFYQVTGYNSQSCTPESAASNEVKAVIPAISGTGKDKDKKE